MYGIRNPSSGVLTVNNTDFQNNGFALLLSSTVDFIHTNNTATNNSINGIVMGGTTNADRTWTKDGIPYVVQSAGSASGTTLTINPGVIVKFFKDNSNLSISGTLNAQGTPTQPILFTSIADDTGGDTNSNGGATTGATGQWTHIRVNSGGIANLTNTTVRFAGHSFTGSPADGGIALFGGTLTLTDSHVTENDNANVFVQSGIATITNSEIDNSRTGILQTLGTVTVSGSSIHDNSLFGAFAGSLTVMDAHNNWWGDTTGPFHSTNPTGLGNQVSDNVNFIPFLNTDPVGSLP